MQIRNFVSCPILFLTARVEDSDKIKGFGVGADDYIVKPFSIDELGARVSAHLRRERRQRESAKVRFDDKLAIDYTERSLYYNGEPIPLAKKEFDIIELLSQHIGQVYIGGYGQFTRVFYDTAFVLYAQYYNEKQAWKLLSVCNDERKL